MNTTNSSNETGRLSYCSPSQCGDGMLGNGEECDDGNLLSTDGCSSSCTIEAGCLAVRDLDGLPRLLLHPDRTLRVLHTVWRWAPCGDARAV